MKKLIILLLAVCMTVSSAAAESTRSVEENIEISFNSHISVLGGVSLDPSRMFRYNDFIVFPCDGFDVSFQIQDGKISGGGVRLEDESAAGSFLLACMSMVAMLGDIDYSRFGAILFNYGKLTTGRTETMLEPVGSDYFQLSKTDNFAAIFSYVNTDLEERK